MIFLAKNNQVLQPTFAHCLVMPKHTSGELIIVLQLKKYLFLNYACFSLNFHNSSSTIVLGVCTAPLG
jgi:hypothetical protein